MAKSDGLLDDIPRGAPRRGGKKTRLEDHILPLAQFRDPAEIARSVGLQHADNKLFLGVVYGTVKSRRLPDGRIERHVLGGYPIGSGDDMHAATVAGSRSGKGRGGTVPVLLTYKGSVLVTDPKGELFNITALYRARELGQRVIGLDPFRIAGDHVAHLRGGFNPMTILRPDSPTLIEDAALIAVAIVILGIGEPHWDETACYWIEIIILHVATHPAYEGRRNLVTVYRLLMRGVQVGVRYSYEALRDEMMENEAANGAVQDGALSFFDKAEEELSGVLSTARRHAKWLSYPAMQDVLTVHDFDLEDLKRQLVTLYLILPARHLGSCSRWFRLFVNLMLAIMEREQVKPKLPVLLCLDEFAVMGHMPAIENAVGQIAGFGVRLWLILQDLTQLKALYKDRWESMLANCGTLQFFGNNDTFTLEWIAKRLGKTSLVVARGSDVPRDSRDKHGGSGASWGLEVQDLMTGEEVSRYFGRGDRLARQLVIRAGDDPMILQRVNYDTHELFKGKFHE